MSAPQSLHITLSPEMAQLVKSKMASGEYASEEDVITEGLFALAARDDALEEWLHNTVKPTLAAIDADPSRMMSADETWEKLLAHMTR